MISPRITIVEDDADLRRVLVEGLQEEDFDVRACTTAGEGVNSMR